MTPSNYQPKRLVCSQLKFVAFCQRINLQPSECVNYFIQGFQPHIKNYVLLQRPGTIEDTEMHAKLKESLPELLIN